MKRIAMIFAAAATVAIAAACTKNENSAPAAGQDTAGTVSFTIGEITKVAMDASDLSMKFEEGDLVSINGVCYPVSRGEGDVMVIEGVAKADDGQYDCIFEGTHSYIGNSDSNYKVQNYQFYREGSFASEMMPLICCKKVSGADDMTLNFRPLLGVVKIPVQSATPIEVRSIKLEKADFAYGTWQSYMSGRCIPFNAEGTEVKTVDESIVRLALGGGTAEIREMVLLCNDPSGKGVVVDGSKDFYMVVIPQTYDNGLRLTINTADHRTMTVATEGPSTVSVGGVLAMKPVVWNPDPKVLYSENFDTFVLGGDPVGKALGYVGWRGMCAASQSANEGKFIGAGASGYEMGHWYSGIASTAPKDEAGRSVTVCCPGSDISSNWHANVSSTTYRTVMENPNNVMSESYFNSRGIADWCLSRALEFHGYMMVGRSKGFASLASASGVTSTASPQGIVQTPRLLNIPEGETRDVRFSVKLSPDFVNPWQTIRINAFGGGLILSASCGTHPVTIGEGGNSVSILEIDKMKNGWTNFEMVIKSATHDTFFMIQAPDGKDPDDTNYKTATFYIDDLLVEEYSGEASTGAHRVGFLGDSITTFAGYSEGGSNFYPYYDPDGDPAKTLSSVKDTYWYKLVYNLMGGQNKVDKVLAYGGTTVINNAKDPRTDFLYRCVNFDNPDIIFIHGGTNDHNYSSPLGSYDYDLPEEQLDETSFRPAYIKLIKMLRRMHPSAQLLIIVGDMLSTDYCTSVVTIAEHFDIPYVSFTGVSVPKCKGSHPNVQGMDIIANKTYSTLKQYLQ